MNMMKLKPIAMSLSPEQKQRFKLLSVKLSMKYDDLILFLMDQYEMNERTLNSNMGLEYVESRTHETASHRDEG